MIFLDAIKIDWWCLEVGEISIAKGGYSYLG